VSLVSFANSRWGPAAGISLVRVLRPRLSRRIADWIASRIASQAGNPTAQSLRANQAIVRQLPLDHPEVEQAAETILRHATAGFVSLFEAMRHGFDGLSHICAFDDELLTIAKGLIDSGTGMLYAGCHMVGFDQLLLYMGSLGYPVQVLAVPEVEGSYSFLNQLRRSFGANVTPIGYRALREAIRNLREGGIVVTGVDRPDAAGEMLEFFGRPARLPVGHARLALQAGAPIMAGASYIDGDGKYRAVSCDVVHTSEYLGQPDAERAIAQRVIRAHEKFILDHMDEWLMFYPVWGMNGEER
jgi:KDO2-lipid IV(A) lauroyltransferase